MRTASRLDSAGKTYEIEFYQNIGHSFFRQNDGKVAAREIAQAWERVQSYLGRVL